MEMDNSWWPSSAHQKKTSHSQQLGNLWTELNSLETALRLVLCEIEGIPHLMARVHAIFEAEVGTVVDCDHFSRQLQLHELIEIFNEHAVSRGAPCVEPEIGEIRHALAHGRVTAISVEHDIRLVNFKGKKGGDLVICYSATLTEAWFKRQRKRVLDAIAHAHSLSLTLRGNA
jgi:hypothetical protein